MQSHWRAVCRDSCSLIGRQSAEIHAVSLESSLQRFMQSHWRAVCKDSCSLIGGQSAEIRAVSLEGCLQRFVHSDWSADSIPDVFHDFLTPAFNKHNYNTRFARNLSVCTARVSTNTSKLSFKFSGSKIWETVPIHL